MKRISQFLSLCLFAALMSVFVSATSLSDSLRIGKENYEILCGGEDDTVIRLYCGNFLDGFADGETILELTGEDHVSSQVFVTRTKRGATSYKTIRDGTAHDAHSGSSSARAIYDVVTKPERIFDGGDYVYYRRSVDDKKEYLFPSDKFTEFAKAAVAARGDGVMSEPSEFFDTAPFELKEKPDYLLILACVIAVAGSALLCVCTAGLRRPGRSRFPLGKIR